MQYEVWSMNAYLTYQYLESAASQGKVRLLIDAFVFRYFDNFEKRCTPFYYGGCEGNRNRFDSQEDCKKSCPAEFLQNDVCQMEQVLIKSL